MSSAFSYILEKINNAHFYERPFKHLYIENFFSKEHFSLIVRDQSINLPEASSDKDLINKLHTLNYKEIVFPGTTTDLSSYLRWHKKPLKNRNTNVETCEGIGVVFRLMHTNVDSFIYTLNGFLSSRLFHETLAKKFNIDLSAVKADQGVQKYLDGYEISPHPDVRRKALTYMININPAEDSESLNIHTHYMNFKPVKKYVETYWTHNQNSDRCWVPWDWCETAFQQTKNNSIVIFQPSDDTLHAVKASYNHLVTQRTQLYGNLWYLKDPTTHKPNWRDFVIRSSRERKNTLPINEIIKDSFSLGKRYVKRALR